MERPCPTSPPGRATKWSRGPRRERARPAALRGTVAPRAPPSLGALAARRRDRDLLGDGADEPGGGGAPLRHGRVRLARLEPPDRGAGEDRDGGRGADLQ